MHGRKTVPGVLMPGTKPVHLLGTEERHKVPAVEDFFVDIGLQKEAAERLVRVGDFVTMERQLLEVGDHVTLRPLMTGWVSMR